MLIIYQSSYFVFDLKIFFQGWKKEMETKKMIKFLMNSYECKHKSFNSSSLISNNF